MVSWKQLLDRHDSLRKKSGVTIYDRVKLLVKVYEHPSYANEMRSKGFPPCDLLDKRVSDTCANFTELMQMLKAFPSRKQWESGDLSLMRIKMIDGIRSKQRAAKSTAGAGRKASKVCTAEDSGTTKTRKKIEVRNTATVAQVRDLKEENARLKEQLKSANSIIKSLESQLEMSRETIGSLNETISLFKLSKTNKAMAKT